jgi:predicted enzyme related to lactoylglutathione lyase
MAAGRWTSSPPEGLVDLDDEQEPPLAENVVGIDDSGGLLILRDEASSTGLEQRWIVVRDFNECARVDPVARPPAHTCARQQQATGYPGAKAYREEMYTAGVPVLGFSGDDLHALHRRLTANGVTFTRAPAEQEYGGIGAVIHDGCGNLLNLHQEATA